MTVHGPEPASPRVTRPLSRGVSRAPHHNAKAWVLGPKICASLALVELGRDVVGSLITRPLVDRLDLGIHRAALVVARPAAAHDGSVVRVS